MERRRAWNSHLLPVVTGCALATVISLSTAPIAQADLTADNADKRFSASQRAHRSEPTNVKVRVRVPSNRGSGTYRAPGAGTGGTEGYTEPAPALSLSIRNCAYYYERSSEGCSFAMATTPAATPAKAKKADDPKAPPVVQISPQQLAMMAVAELQLPAVAAGIGPDPSLNRWKMAAVGYPLWLWADGPTHVGPVSQRVANLYVSLDARLTSVTFEMGDGHTVTCAGPGKKWRRTVEAGQASTCGYRYERPSLPKGSYTVRAISHWDITWVVGGQSGVVTMDQEGARQLPVGELQVLVR